MRISDEIHIYREEMIEKQDFEESLAADIAIDFLDGIGKGLHWSIRAPMIIDALKRSGQTFSSPPLVFWYTIELIEESIQ